MSEHDPLCPMWSKVVAGDRCDCDVIKQAEQRGRGYGVMEGFAKADGELHRRSYEQGQRDAIAAIRDAWLIEGPRPDYHRKAKRHLIRNWPTLANAIIAAIKGEQA